MQANIDDELIREIVREELEAMLSAERLAEMFEVRNGFDDLWTVRRFSKWKFETEEPTKAQINVVTRMCRNGTLPAMKIGKEWRIDTAEIMRGARNEDGKTSDAA